MRLAVLARRGARRRVSLRVLHVNDHHSHIEASAYSFLTTIEEDIAYGGWALMVSAFAALAGDGENVLKVHAGDAITGTSYYSLFDGAPDAAVMNQVCFDAFAVGNHEFDDGDAALATSSTCWRATGARHGHRASHGAVVATFDDAVCLDRFPGEGRSATCDLAATWTRGGGVCNLVATPFRRSLEADVAVQNGGGCRVDIAAGDFTIEDGYEVLPFSNTIVTLDLTGAQLADALGEASQRRRRRLDGVLPYAAGLRFAVDASRPRGSRVSGVEVNARRGRLGARDAAVYALPLLRFAVAGEVGVECVVFRDAESRINAREGAAVRDWLATDAAFHVMHDAPDADARFIASGCFGCRSTDDREPPLPDAAGRRRVRRRRRRRRPRLARDVRPACDAANTVHHSSRGAFLDDGPRPSRHDYRGRRRSRRRRALHAPLTLGLV
ncbi:hypothetical protein JL720_6869 [Aureococcus anophagefferens]|nr:hypothetical protein JL720_6869 [Aureococcus anophagefferens]